MSSFEKVKKFLEGVEDINISFKEHFYDRVSERPISEALVRKSIKNTGKLLSVEEQPAKKRSEEKFKIRIELSNKYHLVLIIVIGQKNLYIVTGWNSDGKWQKAIQK